MDSIGTKNVNAGSNEYEIAREMNEPVGDSGSPWDGDTIVKNTGWDYRGITEAVNKIENAIETLRNNRQASSILRSIDNQLNVIQAALNDNEGNQTVLLSSRRRLRQLRKRLISGDYGEF